MKLFTPVSHEEKKRRLPSANESKNPAGPVVFVRFELIEGAHRKNPLRTVKRGGVIMRRALSFVPGVSGSVGGFYPENININSLFLVCHWAARINKAYVTHLSSCALLAHIR